MTFTFMAITSCGQRVKITPPEYKNRVLVNSQEYSEDSSYLYFVLESMLSKHINPFSPAGYYTKSTSNYIDSILYSPDKLRLIIFVISKVPKSGKELEDNNTKTVEYNADYLFCTRDSIRSNIKVYKYSAFHLAHFDTYKDVQESLNELCFGRRSTGNWSETEPFYNMDDIRFWRSDEFNTIISKYEFIQMQDK